MARSAGRCALAVREDDDSAGVEVVAFGIARVAIGMRLAKDVWLPLFEAGSSTGVCVKTCTEVMLELRPSPGLGARELGSEECVLIERSVCERAAGLVSVFVLKTGVVALRPPLAVRRLGLLAGSRTSRFADVEGGGLGRSSVRSVALVDREVVRLWLDDLAVLSEVRGLRSAWLDSGSLVALL